MKNYNGLVNHVSKFVDWYDPLASVRTIWDIAPIWILKPEAESLD